MRERVTISDVAFVPAGYDIANTGLLGWITCTINGVVRLRGITLRRTSQGRLAFSFPSRRDSSGRMLPFVKPVGSAVRREMLRQILAAIGLEEPVA
jgi:hypothetical protein